MIIKILYTSAFDHSLGYICLINCVQYFAKHVPRLPTHPSHIPTPPSHPPTHSSHYKAVLHTCLTICVQSTPISNILTFSIMFKCAIPCINLFHSLLQFYTTQRKHVYLITTRVCCNQSQGGRKEDSDRP